MGDHRFLVRGLGSTLQRFRRVEGVRNPTRAVACHVANSDAETVIELEQIAEFVGDGADSVFDEFDLRWASLVGEYRRPIEDRKLVSNSLSCVATSHNPRPAGRSLTVAPRRKILRDENRSPLYGMPSV